MDASLSLISIWLPREMCLSIVTFLSVNHRKCQWGIRDVSLSNLWPVDWGYISGSLCNRCSMRLAHTVCSGTTASRALGGWPHSHKPGLITLGWASLIWGCTDSDQPHFPHTSTLEALVFISSCVWIWELGPLTCSCWNPFLSMSS